MTQKSPLELTYMSLYVSVILEFARASLPPGSCLPGLYAGAAGCVTLSPPRLTSPFAPAGAGEAEYYARACRMSSTPGRHGQKDKK